MSTKTIPVPALLLVPPRGVATVGLGGPGGFELDAAWYERKKLAREVAWDTAPEAPHRWIVNEVLGFTADGLLVWNHGFSPPIVLHEGDTISFRIDL